MDRISAVVAVAALIASFAMPVAAQDHRQTDGHDDAITADRSTSGDNPQGEPVHDQSDRSAGPIVVVPDRARATEPTGILPDIGDGEAGFVALPFSRVLFERQKPRPPRAVPATPWNDWNWLKGAGG